MDNTNDIGMDIETDIEQPEEQSVEIDDYAQLHDTHLRLMAEYDNFRKRTQKERESLYGMATSAAVMEFLPVHDNIERALAAETVDESYKRGVGMIMKQFLETLERLGVTEIPSERGTAFDPELHNAVMHVEDDTLAATTIAETFQKGFRIGDRVIRHAVVKAAN